MTSEKREASEAETKQIFQEKFLNRLAEASNITRRMLDEQVKLYGFVYVQANTLWVHSHGFKHFGSDLLTAYRENPARAPSNVDNHFKYMRDRLKGCDGIP